MPGGHPSVPRRSSLFPSPVPDNRYRARECADEPPSQGADSPHDNLKATVIPVTVCESGRSRHMRRTQIWTGVVVNPTPPARECTGRNSLRYPGKKIFSEERPTQDSPESMPASGVPAAQIVPPRATSHLNLIGRVRPLPTSAHRPPWWT